MERIPMQITRAERTVQFNMGKISFRERFGRGKDSLYLVERNRGLLLGIFFFDVGKFCHCRNVELGKGFVLTEGKNLLAMVGKFLPRFRLGSGLVDLLVVVGLDFRLISPRICVVGEDIDASCRNIYGFGCSISSGANGTEERADGRGERTSGHDELPMLRAITKREARGSQRADI